MGKSRSARRGGMVLLGLILCAGLVLGAVPAHGDHEPTHLRCPNDPTRFVPDCGPAAAPATQPTTTATALPRTGPNADLAIYGLALIGLGLVLQRRWRALAASSARGLS